MRIVTPAVRDHSAFDIGAFECTAFDADVSAIATLWNVLNFGGSIEPDSHFESEFQLWFHRHEWGFVVCHCFRFLYVDNVCELKDVSTRSLLSAQSGGNQIFIID